mmetsp:Transcript_75800/g.181268  ORF Transcript_75800/g.181268 Transcript_75800/m.181268 type:complete len:206 (-) Transcript_75800:7068-7685(-)
MTLEGQNVAIEVSPCQELEKIGHDSQGHNGPSSGFPKRSLSRDWAIQRLGVNQGRSPGHSHGNPVSQHGRQSSANGDQREAQKAALQGIPLVPQDRHDGTPHRRSSCHIQAHRHQDGDHEDLRTEVEIAQVPQTQRSKQGPGRQQAAEVAHGPGPPAVHPHQHGEDQRQSDGTHQAHRQSEVADLRRLPAVQGPPLREGLGRVGG